MDKQIHDWDRPLTVSEIEALSPSAKGARSRTALSRKVAVLEKWLKSDELLRENVDLIPWTRPKLREWNDEQNKLWGWKNAKVDLPRGKNSDLIDRYTSAIMRIRDIDEKKFYDKDRIISKLNGRIKELEIQNLALLDQILRLQSKVRK